MEGVRLVTVLELVSNGDIVLVCVIGVIGVTSVGESTDFRGDRADPLYSEPVQYEYT